MPGRKCLKVAAPKSPFNLTFQDALDLVQLRFSVAMPAANWAGLQETRVVVALEHASFAIPMVIGQTVRLICTSSRTSMITR